MEGVGFSVFDFREGRHKDAAVIWIDFNTTEQRLIWSNHHIFVFFDPIENFCTRRYPLSGEGA